MPGGSAAATSSAASARRSSRCRPRSICCARCASRPTTPKSSRSRRPIPPIPTAPSWRGPAPATNRRRRPHDAQRRLAGHPRQRRARRVHQPRRAPAAGLPARGRAGAIDGGARASRGAARRRWREAAGCSSPRSTASRPRSIRSRRSWSTPASAPSAMGFMMRRCSRAPQLPASSCRLPRRGVAAADWDARPARPGVEDAVSRHRACAHA